MGVCRDFAHLAITFRRCIDVAARYWTGYLGDIGVVPDPAPMDFSAWFEVFLDGKWYSADARHNMPRIVIAVEAHLVGTGGVTRFPIKRDQQAHGRRQYGSVQKFARRRAFL